MAIPQFNTLEMAKKLENKAKFERVQAENLTEILAEAMQSSELATKSDLKEVETALKNDMEKMEIALKSDIKEVEAKIDKVEAGLKGDIKEVEIALKGDIKEVKAEIKAIQEQNKITLGLTMAIFAAILAASIKIIAF